MGVGIDLNAYELPLDFGSIMIYAMMVLLYSFNNRIVYNYYKWKMEKEASQMNEEEFKTD